MATATVDAWVKPYVVTDNLPTGTAPAAASGVYSVDYINGDDTNTGAPGWPWKHDPDMANATGVAASVTLSANDVIEYVPGHWKLAAGCGIAPSAVDGVIRRTVPGSAENVKLDYRQYSTDDWVDQGSNVWRYTVGGTARPGRAWVNDVALTTVWDQGDLTADRPWYDGDTTYAYVYCTQDPWLEWGDSLCWSRISGETTGIRLAYGTARDLSFEDIDIYGPDIGFLGYGDNDYCTLDNVNVYGWYNHGIKFLGTGDIPVRYASVTYCRSDMLTQIDEFPMIGERFGDSFAFQGSCLGCSFTYCHAQDCHHSAFMMNAHNTVGTTFGCIACETGWCTADNTNSFYGRGIGSVGGLVDDYHNAYNIIHHNEFTNMQMRSQISGDHIRVYNNKFCGTQGSFVRGAAVYEYRWNGQGLMMGIYNDAGFGEQSVTNCEVFNNTFSDNWNEGLRMQSSDGSRAGGNTFYNNVFHGNFKSGVPDPGLSGIADCDIVLYYENGTGLPSPANVWTDNFISRRDGDAADTVVISRLEPNAYDNWDVADFNLEGTNSGNDADVASLKLTPSGDPVTGSAVKSSGTLPSLAPDNLIVNPNDITAAGWGNAANVTRDEFGATWDAANYAAYNLPAKTVSFPTTMTWSYLIGTRPGTTVTSNVDNTRPAMNDGVGGVDYAAFTPIAIETLDLAQQTKAMDVAGDKNWVYAHLNQNITYPAEAEMAYARLAEESTATPPRWNEYDRLDFNGSDQGATYVGADATIAAPVVPNLVQDAFGARYTEAQASALITAYFFTVGTISYQVNGGVPSGEVISQGTAAGTTGAVNDSIDLVVSQ